jgi:hypothetical protein
MPAVLVFLVHSERRRDAIRKLFADPEKPVRIPVRAFTFTEAPGVLGGTATTRAAPSARAVATITAAELDLLGSALEALDAASSTRGTSAEARRALVTEAAGVIARLRASACRGDVLRQKDQPKRSAIGRGAR